MAIDMKFPDNTYFTVAYDKKGDVIELQCVENGGCRTVEPKKSKKNQDGKEEFEDTLNDINAAETSILLFKKGSRIPICFLDASGKRRCFW